MSLVPSSKRSSSRSVARRQTLALSITEALRQEIVSGVRLPGSKVSEPSIAGSQNVSRAPVREALRQLEREGLVVFDAVGRCRVVELTSDDVEDICGLRVSLESTAASHAAARFSDATQRVLHDNLEQMESATTLDEVSMLDLAFHGEVMEASGRRRLIAAWRAIEPQLRLWLGTLQRRREAISADVLASTVAAHRQLIEVLASGDRTRAREFAAFHVASWVDGNDTTM
jgi:DNA-binding GntR family transcriptional regulator